VRVAVNFSARQFQDEDISVVVAAILEQCDLAPRFLEIEITESDILKSPSRVQSLLKEFTDLGVRVALDDFGTGYSSLNHLRSFPGASIKIDRSFVRNVCSERHDAAIVRSLIVMAHSLNLKVIAEGVETAEQLAFLRKNDCDAIQGYLIRRPAPAEDFGPDIFVRPLIANIHRPSLTA
jgi:EAL domain-containing protein (putative c-di-GMP-specific phosphodiesterase class I)